MGKKFTLELVKARFAVKGHTLLATEYTNAHALMPYICVCGNTAVINLNNMQSGSKCAACSGSETKRYSYQFVKQTFEDRDCILLSEEYKNADVLLDYVCSCGSISTIRFGNFLQGSLCAQCAPERIGLCNITHGKYSIYQNRVEPHVSVISYTTWRLKFKCDCGVIEERSYNGQTLANKRCCSTCLLKRRQQALNRSCHDYRLWRTAVLETDNYTCVKCGGNEDLRAHHIEPWAVNEALRFIVGNGSTLCYPCHKEFHSVYGLKAATELFTKFIVS